MKKILNTLLLTLAIIGMASCSDNGEGEYIVTNSIKIVSQTVSDMAVKASEGTIVVQAPTQINATASSDWFTTSVSGNIITVKTTDNTGIDYRSGKVIIKSGNDVAEIAVIQKGTIISIEAKDQCLDDAKKTIEIPYYSNVDLKCVASESWITCKAEDGILTLSIDENTTGHSREGYVFYEAGELKDSINIRQCDLEKDLLGKMLFVYYDAKSKDYATLNTEFVKATNAEGATSFALVLSDLGFTIPVSYDSATNTIQFKAGQFAGTYQNYNIITVLYDANTGNMTTDDKFGMKGSFYYDNDDQATYLEFENDGTWDEGEATSLILYAFDAENKPVGSLATFHFPYLMK